MSSGKAVRKALLNKKPIPGLSDSFSSSNIFDTQMSRASRADFDLSTDQQISIVSNRQPEIKKLR